MAVRINPGVPKEVDRRPGRPVGDTEGVQGVRDVVRAIQVAGKAAILIAARGAGHAEGIVAATGVLHHTQHGIEVPVVELVKQAGPRIGPAHHGAGGCAVNRALQPFFQCIAAQRHEIGALLTFEINDLDHFAGF